MAWFSPSSLRIGSK